MRIILLMGLTLLLSACNTTTTKWAKNDYVPPNDSQDSALLYGGQQFFVVTTDENNCAVSTSEGKPSPLKLYAGKEAFISARVFGSSKKSHLDARYNYCIIKFYFTPEKNARYRMISNDNVKIPKNGIFGPTTENGCSIQLIQLSDGDADDDSNPQGTEPIVPMQGSYSYVASNGCYKVIKQKQ